MKDFRTGDIIEYYQDPKPSDWDNIGEVSIFFNYGETFTVEGSDMFGNSAGIFINGYWYPSICFRKVNDNPEYIIY